MYVIADINPLSDSVLDDLLFLLVSDFLEFLESQDGVLLLQNWIGW